ncbi:MAG: hypothetical protein ACC655_11835 [Rhodothermia bacterium]
MNDADRSDDVLWQANEALKQELRVLGRDAAMFDDLLPDEMNLRLKKALRFAEEETEAQLLGKEPPPRFLDPMSPDWIPDVDDMVHRNAQQLLGDDLPLVSETNLSDDEVAERLGRMIAKLADKGIGFGINETVPKRIAYRYLLEELSDGMDVMPGWVLDGCDGSCEECFQLPYCESGKQMAAEYGFDVPSPPIPPRHVDRTVRGQSARN